MDEYKIAFIHSIPNSNKNIYDGKLELFGKNDGTLHVTYLLDYIKKNYQDNTVLSRLNSRHDSGTISALISMMYKNIIFLNNSHDKNEKSGIFILPNEISIKQKETLYKFLEDIKDYDIVVTYDLKLDDGIIDYQALKCNGKNVVDILNKYFEMKENVPTKK